MFYCLWKLEVNSFSGRSAVKPNHFNTNALKIYEYIKQMVASAKFGSIWEGQNRVIQFLNFLTFDLRLNLFQEEGSYYEKYRTDLVQEVS